MKKARKLKRWGVALGVIVVIAALIFLPFPTKIKRELVGAVYSEDSSDGLESCVISIDGMKYNYLFKTDSYHGDFIISTDAKTAEAEYMTASLGKGVISFLIYWTDDGYYMPGVFISADNLSWLYMQQKQADGSVAEIMAPAATREEALAIKEKASRRVHAIPELPSNTGDA